MSITQDTFAYARIMLIDSIGAIYRERDAMTLETLYTTNITQKSDIRTAAAQLGKVATAMGGFRVAASDSIASKHPMVDESGAILAEDMWGWIGSDERWWLNTRMALTSPIPRATRYESDTFWCNADGFYTRQPNSYLAELDRNDFFKRTGVNAAIVVPVHLPLGQIGCVAFTPTDNRTDLSAEYAKYADDLWLICSRFISGYAKIMCGRHIVPGDCQLTKREVECLRWAAVGKTDREISVILSRSHATIRFHIKNAGEKLNTVNRSQTIFKAAQLGFLNVAV
jgi:DNA-binding CsgD family transcriptional regulator